MRENLWQIHVLFLLAQNLCRKFCIEGEHKRLIHEFTFLFLLQILPGHSLMRSCIPGGHALLLAIFGFYH